MNEIEKRMGAALDLVTWLDNRIAQQIEFQLGKRLEREREYWRCSVSDLITAEREQLAAQIGATVSQLVDLKAGKIFDKVESVLEGSEQMVAKVGADVDRMFDRLEARLENPTLRPDDSEPPPSTH
jgi:hypothetical protein